jgi:hypothetical protein
MLMSYSMRALVILSVLTVLAGCNRRAEVATVVAPSIYATNDEIQEVQSIAGDLLSYQDGSPEERFELNSIRKVEADLERMNPASDTWKADLEQLRGDIEALKELNDSVTKYLIS